MDESVTAALHYQVSDESLLMDQEFFYIHHDCAGQTDTEAYECICKPLHAMVRFGLFPLLENLGPQRVEVQ